VKKILSKNVQGLIEANSIYFNNVVYEMKTAGVDIITLSLGEAFFDLPLYSFDDLPFPDIYHYSHSRGIIPLRKKIAEYFHKEYSFEFNPETNIIITAGSKVAIYMTFSSILDIDEEVIIPEPYWVSYTEQVKLCHGVPITVPIDESIYDIEKYITQKTKCIVINNPHNPSGKNYSLDELTYLHNLAKKYDILVLSDEAYSDFLIEGEKFISMGSIDKDMTHSVVFNSISKNYGISGWRLGYVIAQPSIIEQVLKVNQHLITCPATILEYYIDKHFWDIINITKPQIQKVVKQRETIKKYFDEVGLICFEGSAAWYFFTSIKPSLLNSTEFCLRLLNEYNVSCVPGVGYGKSCDEYIRVCVGTESIERIKKGIDSINKLINISS
jgi:aminotransferase